MPYPNDLATVEQHKRLIKRALRDAGVPDNLVSGIETRALRSGRRQTGAHQSNRASRWTLNPQDPQFGTEIDCKIIFNRLVGMLFEFQNPPAIPDEIRELLAEHYVGHEIVPGTFKDALLLEQLDYNDFLAESQNPRHGHSNFHIGHLDPTVHPKHIPDNIFWRTYRSNLIQGNMTLREARIYIIRLIARYFELGELAI